MSEKIFTVIYFHEENDYTYSPVVIASVTSQIEANILMLQKYQEKAKELCQNKSKDDYEFYFDNGHAVISDENDNSYEFEIFENVVKHLKYKSLEKEYNDLIKSLEQWND